MGERKGQNFYYPPDFDYKKHNSLNSYHGTHALRERAKKIKQGILVIRFEMPFNIWCLGCHNHVGMGVRYNAEKKKIGMYYTTPLYEFRMKCHLCDNYYVIRTDPKNFDYELVEGCTRQEKRYDPSTIDQLGPVDRQFSQKLAADAMFKAEHEEQDKTKSISQEDRIEKIEWIQDRMRDDFAANQALRARFRREKKDLSEKRIADDDLRSRSSLSIPLAPEDPNDAKVASMFIRYRTVQTEDERRDEKRKELESKRMFSTSSIPSTSNSSSLSLSSADRLKRSIKLERNKKINDQFEFTGPPTKKMINPIGIVKKTVSKESESHANDLSTMNTEDPPPTQLLVDYGNSSDSE